MQRPTPLRLSTIPLFTLLAACSTTGEPTDFDDAPPFGTGEDLSSSGELEGQSGTEVPDLCLETSRSVVTDASQIAPGMSFSIDALLIEVSGSWTGTLARPDDEPALALDVAPGSGPMYAVVREWVSSDDSGGPVGAEPIEEGDGCHPLYELPLNVSVSSAPLLDETFEVVATSGHVDQLEFGGSLDPEDVAGTTQPGFDPNDYESHELGLLGRIDAGAAHGSVVWRGLNDSDAIPPMQESCDLGGGAEGCVDPDTGECGACSGVVGPPSVVEPVGFFQAHK